MRKLFVALALASIVSVLALSGSASADNQGADWLAAGTGTLICCNQPMVHVNTQSGTAGVNPRGHFWIRYPNGGAEFGGHIVCLTVAGLTAGMIGRIDDVVTPSVGLGFVAGNYLNITVTDSGPGDPVPDMVNFSPGGPNASCSPQGGFPISQGNYVVHDQAITDPLQLDLLNQFLAQIEAAANDPYG
jgi:hypothetical protein